MAPALSFSFGGILRANIKSTKERASDPTLKLKKNINTYKKILSYIFYIICKLQHNYLNSMM